jgi:hypothetical protein
MRSVRVLLTLHQMLSLNSHADPLGFASLILNVSTHAQTLLPIEKWIEG